MHRVRRSVVTPITVTVCLLALAAVPMAAAAEEGEHHAMSLADFFWPVVNFAIMCGVLYYFLKTPLAGYLKGRSDTIRKDLVDAEALRTSATAQLDEIDRKMKALPDELEALRTRGQAEIAAEEQRIAQQAAAERDRLIEQARRDIDLQVRLAKRALTEHAADLALDLATERIGRETTPDDHARLVNRYLEQVKG